MKKQTRRPAGKKPAKAVPPRRKAKTAKPAATPGTDQVAAVSDAAQVGQGGLPIVGIGASAGGLDAFKRFLAATPADSGMAFVLIQHLDPNHKSLMVDLLANSTSMPLVQAEDRMPVEANHVYMIPPNKYLTIREGVLHLTAPTERRGMRMPIDNFLRSLAEDQQERAIGVILSGTGMEGAQGLKDIKEHGGMAMVQDPETAAFDGMPRNAIATGMVDYILPVEQMPDRLVKYVRHSYVRGAAEPDSAQGEEANPVHGILELLAARARHDFWYYKKATLRRRIARRMGLCHVERTGDYLKYLHDHPAEVTQLCKDLLIGVSSFFRDPVAFQVLEESVIPQLLKQRDSGTALRVWVPGCATGEEAYSLAMLLVERAQAAHEDCKIQIFATDADAEALEFGRAGVYPESIVAHMPPERLHRHFAKKGHTYHVSPALRDLIYFSQQNLITDAPFSKMDLVSCRNVLIYLEPVVQSKVVSLFHFALREGGYLFLGNAETVGSHEDLFEPLSKKWRVYRRIGPAQRWRVDFPIVRGGARDVAQPAARPGPTLPAEIMREALLSEFVPPSVLIDRKGVVVYLHGALGRYLDLPAGEPTHDLLAMAHESLRGKLRTALHTVIRGNEPVIVRGARLDREQTSCSVRITLKPVRAEGFYLVAFEEEPETAPLPRPGPDPADDGEAALEHLEYELESTRENLHGIIAEMEATQEELKASNEEMMSLNEEFQSTNEELETSKEELQSLNEELSTVNSQLQSKIEELESTNNDLSNLLTCTDIAIVFLDTDFRVRRFAPSATNLLNLIPADIGRPISDIASQFPEQTLLADARQVLARLASVEREVCSASGRWYVRRILPYRTRDQRVEGVVVTFSDIDRLKRAEEELQALNETLEQRVIERTASRDRAEAELIVAQREVIDIATSEHQRIGQELHDGLGQQLAGIGLLARSLHANLAQKSLPEAGKAAQLLDDVETMYAQIHSLARGFWPVEVDAHGLRAALENLATTTARESGLDTTFECGEPPVLDNEIVAASLYGIAREALANAVKHARAGHLRLALEQSAGALTLRVHDDGVGIPPGTEQKAGMGLHIMRYRASVIGARLAVDSAPGSGTCVTCTIRQEGGADR